MLKKKLKGSSRRKSLSKLIEGKMSEELTKTPIRHQRLLNLAILSKMIDRDIIKIKEIEGIIKKFNLL